MKKIIIFIFCFVFLTSCKTIQYVPVETIKTDTIVQKELQVEIIQDSIYYEVTHKGDTVFIEKDKWHTVIKEKHDTLIDIQFQKVPEPYEVEKIVTVHPWYENILWFLSIIFILYVIKKIMDYFQIG